MLFWRLSGIVESGAEQAGQRSRQAARFHCAVLILLRRLWGHDRMLYPAWPRPEQKCRSGPATRFYSSNLATSGSPLLCARPRCILRRGPWHADSTTSVPAEDPWRRLRSRCGGARKGPGFGVYMHVVDLHQSPCEVSRLVCLCVSIRSPCHGVIRFTTQRHAHSASR
jgi:hypothetical protein